MMDAATQVASEQIVIAFGLALASLLSALAMRVRQRTHLANGGYRRPARTTIQTAALAGGLRNNGANGAASDDILATLEKINEKIDRSMSEYAVLKRESSHAIELHALRLDRGDKERLELREAVTKMTLSVSRMEGYMQALKDSK